ncbi:hypothetical protein NQ318_012763 [Aromia moschata]|uniref:Non-homologous end-joining factor 1 n=1 Tax=Aromia moschata TaxID=1265417 RepID=A0AAV8YG98_9CUCU|nr:hypothetical protein NQ318_012763 [Aromia moschata]
MAKSGVWKTFTICDDVYMLKVTEANGEFRFCISDLKEIWCGEYTKERLVDSFKECNPSISIGRDEAIAQILRILDHINEADVTVTRSDGKIDVDVKSDITGLDTKFKVKYKLDLVVADKEKFVQEITAPMVHTINYLEKQQKMLCNLIEKKDRELEEYRMEKGVISRADLMTEKFNPDVIEKSSKNLMLDVYVESTKFWEKFVEKYGNVEKKVIEVNVEPWNHVKRKRKIYNSKTSSKKVC